MFARTESKTDTDTEMTCGVLGSISCISRQHHVGYRAIAISPVNTSTNDAHFEVSTRGRAAVS